jgi:hypothetical protein
MSTKAVEGQQCLQPVRVQMPRWMDGWMHGQGGWTNGYVIKQGSKTLTGHGGSEDVDLTVEFFQLLSVYSHFYG